jgi:hypothetical protein
LKTAARIALSRRCGWRLLDLDCFGDCHAANITQPANVGHGARRRRRTLQLGNGR